MCTHGYFGPLDYYFLQGTRQIPDIPSLIRFPELISFKEKDTHLYKPGHYFLNIKEYPFSAYVIPEAMGLPVCLTIRQEHNLLLRSISEARFFISFPLF